MTDYKCGCRSRDGIVIERCAWATATKARIAELEGNVRLVPVPGIHIGRDGVQVIDCIDYRWADQDEALHLCRELSAHYPSKFAAPTPCGPAA